MAKVELRACAKTIPQFLQDNEGKGALKNSVFSLQIARIGRFERVLQAFEKTAELFLHNSLETISFSKTESREDARRAEAQRES